MKLLLIYNSIFNNSQFHPWSQNNPSLFLIIIIYCQNYSELLLFFCNTMNPTKIHTSPASHSDSPTHQSCSYERTPATKKGQLHQKMKMLHQKKKTRVDEQVSTHMPRGTHTKNKYILEFCFLEGSIFWSCRQWKGGQVEGWPMERNTVFSLRCQYNK